MVWLGERRKQLPAGAFVCVETGAPGKWAPFPGKAEPMIVRPCECSLNHRGVTYHCEADDSLHRGDHYDGQNRWENLSDRIRADRPLPSRPDPGLTEKKPRPRRRAWWRRASRSA